MGSPLDGVRVLELGYGIAAPVAARNLAEFGADVIRVESARHLDSLRVGGAGWIPPDFDQAVRRDTMPSLNFSSAEKRSIGLDIDIPDGRGVFERLVAGSDVLITNISEAALAHLDLGDEPMRAVNPALVYVSMPAFGYDGPYRSYRTWGHNLSAMSGIDHLIGWPDRDPVQLGIAYPDFVSAHAVTVAVLAALQRRDDTGRGACIELAELPMALACLGPSLLQAQLGGDPPSAREPRRVVRPAGDLSRPRRGAVGGGLGDRRRDVASDVHGARSRAPRRRAGVHVGRGASRAARASSTSTWRRGPQTAPTGRPPPSCRRSASRRRRSSTPGTSSRIRSSRPARLLPRAPARAVRARDLVFGQAVRLSDTPPRAERAAPAFGADSRDVLHEVAGLDDAEIDDLVASGVVEEMAHIDVVFERPYLHWIGKVMRQVPWGAAEFDPATEMMRRLEPPGES